MTFRFRNFQVYQEALQGYKDIVTLTRDFPREFDHLRNQIRRAALSVALNIAEGSGKSSDRDFNRYIGNALGSVNEVVAALDAVYGVELVTEKQVGELVSFYESVTRQLGGFSKKLKAE